MAVPEESDVTTVQPAELAHLATAVLCAMAVAPLVWSVGKVAAEPGTEGWSWIVYGLLLLAGLFLVSLARRHLNWAWGSDHGQPARGEFVYAVVIDGLVAVTLAVIVWRGPASRALLAGMGDALPAVLTATAASILVQLYRYRRTNPQPSPEPKEGEPRPKSDDGLFTLMMALMLVAGLMWLERQPLPAEQPPPAQQTEDSQP